MPPRQPYFPLLKLYLLLLCKYNVCMGIGVCKPWWTSSAVCVRVRMSVLFPPRAQPLKLSSSGLQVVNVSTHRAVLLTLTAPFLRGKWEDVGRKGSRSPHLQGESALRARRVVTVWLGKHITSCSVLCSPACVAGAKRLRKSSPWRKSSPAWSSKRMITDMTTSVPAINTAPLEGRSIRSVSSSLFWTDIVREKQNKTLAKTNGKPCLQEGVHKYKGDYF